MRQRLSRPALALPSTAPHEAIRALAFCRWVGLEFRTSVRQAPASETLAFRSASGFCVRALRIACRFPISRGATALSAIAALRAGLATWADGFDPSACTVDQCRDVLAEAAAIEHIAAAVKAQAAARVAQSGAWREEGAR